MALFNRLNKYLQVKVVDIFSGNVYKIEVMEKPLYNHAMQMRSSRSCQIWIIRSNNECLKAKIGG